MWKSIEEKRKYDREWRAKKRAEEKQQKIAQTAPLTVARVENETKTVATPCHFNTAMFIALVIAIVTAGVSLWYAMDACHKLSAIMGP